VVGVSVLSSYQRMDTVVWTTEKILNLKLFPTFLFWRTRLEYALCTLSRVEKKMGQTDKRTDERMDAQTDARPLHYAHQVGWLGFNGAFNTI